MNAGTIVPQYIDLRLPDGTHSGVRVDWQRGIVEIRKRGINYYFDVTVLVTPIENDDEVCYNFNS